MWPISAAVAAALAQSHGIAVTVDAVRDGVYLGRVPFDVAIVRITGRNRERRKLELVTAEELFPSDPADMLSPWGTELLVQYSVLGADGMPLGDAVPVFFGGIDTPDRVRRSGRLTVSCSDRMADINAAKFLAPRVPASGRPVVDNITSLLQEVIPQVAVDNRCGSEALVPVGIMWERDRGAAVDELASSIAAEVVARPDGGFLIRPVPTIADPVAWTATVGAAGVIVADQSAVSRAGVRNAWVVSSERVDAAEAPIRVVVYDLDPASPTRWDGPLRQRPGFWSSSLITSEYQGLAAAAARLARSRGLARTRRLTLLPNPALDAGDVLAVAVDGEFELHIIDDAVLTLHPDDAGMQVETRSVEVPES